MVGIELVRNEHATGWAMLLFFFAQLSLALIVGYCVGRLIERPLSLPVEHGSCGCRHLGGAECLGCDHSIILSDTEHCPEPNPGVP